MVQGPCGHVLYVGDRLGGRCKSRAWWSTVEGCLALLGSTSKGFIQSTGLSWVLKDAGVFIYKANLDIFY